MHVFIIDKCQKGTQRLNQLNEPCFFFLFEALMTSTTFNLKEINLIVNLKKNIVSLHIR